MSTPGVVIIGAGPAGLAAAVTAAGAGMQVTIIDERPRPGGRLLYDLPGNRSAAEYLADCERLGIRIRSNTIGWGLFPGWQLPLSTPDGADRIETEHIILATGATDRALMFEGNTLPGVMTGSALRRLIGEYGVLPGKRVLVLGGGQEAAMTADIVRNAGGQILMLLGEAEARSIVVRGEGGVEWVKIKDHERPVDIIAVAVGRQPDLQLVAMAEMELGWSPERGGWSAGSDRGLLVAGDAAGVDTVEICELDGELVATRLAANLGLVDQSAVDIVSERLRKRRPERLTPSNAAPQYQQPWQVPFEVNR